MEKIFGDQAFWEACSSVWRHDKGSFSSQSAIRGSYSIRCFGLSQEFRRVNLERQVSEDSRFKVIRNPVSESSRHKDLERAGPVPVS